MNNLAPIGHNQGPDLIDEAIAPYSDAISEAENWLDGTPVETEAQMTAVDAILKEIRAAGTALANAQKSATAPLHDAWKAEIARWKPTTDDIERIKKGLVNAVDLFKRKLAEEKEAARRAAYAEAERQRKAAEAAAALADQSDIEAQREADALRQSALDAQAAAAAANKDTVKGLRTVTRYEVIDAVALARILWADDREEQMAFQAERARKLNLHIPGVFEQRKEKVTY